MGLFKKKSLMLALLPLAVLAILPLSCCDTHVSNTWSEGELTPLLAESFEDYVGIDYPISDFEVFLAPERLAVSYVTTWPDDPEAPGIPAGSEFQVDMLVGILVTEEGALSVEVTEYSFGGIPYNELIGEMSTGCSNIFTGWGDAIESSLSSILILDGVIDEVMLEDGSITLNGTVH
ncbi:hypothetical protein ACFLVP_02220 [Chloroflexota bacterium]